MVFIGNFALALGLLLALYAAAASLIGVRQKKPALVESANHALWTMAGMVGVAVGVLLSALLTSDFTIKYVAEHSSTTLPTVYKVTALWGGQEGSLLLWTFLLTAFAAIVAWQNRRTDLELTPYALFTLAAVATFFLAMLNFVTPPFARAFPRPPEGGDLNPLLQNYWMAIHPPSLYTGYVSTTVPFAFAVAALISGRLDDAWIRRTRRWALFSWFFLTLGNLFGARWAYEVLGWGGYWAWDPVENAAFMPWLMMTAYLHSVMIQERKDMLKVWNLALIGLAFALTLFGTFITRSGVISSVHSFTQSGLGPYFSGFLGLVIVSYTALLLYRIGALRSPAELESFLSREAAFLFNNLVLVGIAFAVFWGTIFPIISEAVRGVKITVGPPFFNEVNAPLGLALLFLMGVGPLIAWRRATVRNLALNFTMPAVLGAAVGSSAALLGITQWYALTTLSLAAFVAATVMLEFSRGVAARCHTVDETPPRALVNLVAKNNRRYGGYIVHLGVAIAFVGIVASSFFKVEVKRSLFPNQSLDIGDYQLRYVGVSADENFHMERLAARLELSQAGHSLGTLMPARLFYKRQQQPATQIALRSTPSADLYVVFAGLDPKSRLATFQVFLTPLVFWLWAGGVVMALGTVVAMWPDVREREAIARAWERQMAGLRAGEAVSFEGKQF
jgi:cytochrome c-type biogenesis protein CcmF